MKLAIIGAGPFQLPLIQSAKKHGYETHVFAWESGAVGKEYADHFYPISIVEKDEILSVLRPLNVSGVLSVASEVAVPTVAYLATQLNLNGNSINCANNTLNKFIMKKCFVTNNISCAAGVEIAEVAQLQPEKMNLTQGYIVKPVDRSGSLAVELVFDKSSLIKAVEKAISVSFSKKCIVEEYINGPEYSVETISYRGEHRVVAITRKTTNGSPFFVEKHHYISNDENPELISLMNREVPKALTALDVSNGVSHVELKIHNNKIYFIEIGGRMGGDYIGSHLVPLAKGIDFIKLAIDVATNKFSWSFLENMTNLTAGVSFICTPSNSDCDVTKAEQNNLPRQIVEQHLNCKPGDRITKTISSCTRYGYVIYTGEKIDDEALIRHFGIGFK